MVRSVLLLHILLVFISTSYSQYTSRPGAQHWADSVFNTLTDDQRIAQLMILRVSEKTQNGVLFYDKQVGDAIRKYNIGAVCLFQGGPAKQADMINYFQSIAQTPVMVCIDAEWGLGMRFDSIIPLNHQVMLGAVQDASIVYDYGRIVGRQLKRAGIQVNYAPVVDINNNPANPVINDRSFGEDKYKVALYGVQYMKGLQDEGILATAKHFPGHGDVAVDSHLDLPVIKKSLDQLDSLELFPFKEIFKAGVGSVMIAHLYIPSIDSQANRATSISKNNVTELLRNKLGYKGLTFTDALDMQGVAKFFPGGEIAVQSLIAGNDMLCLPHDVGESISRIRLAISNGQLTWDDIYSKCKKVLAAKFTWGVAGNKLISKVNITADLNSEVNGMKKKVAENAITLLSEKDEILPLRPALQNKAKDVAYIGFGISTDNGFARRMKKDFNADVFYFGYKQDSAGFLPTLEQIKKRYKSLIIGIHNYARFPANNFGISNAAIDFIKRLQENTRSVVFVFGNPYAIKNICNSRNLVACYEDDDITQNAAVDLLEGKISSKGKLPVTICDEFKFGSGIVATSILPIVNPQDVGFDAVKLNLIDSITTDAISRGATPGAVVLVAKNGKIAYRKAFGYFDYDKAERVTIQTIYDMASVTKICATTLAVMKMVDEGKLDLQKTLGDYLPWTRHTNKEKLVIENILLHQAGLVAWIPFYKETIDKNSRLPLSTIYSPSPDDSFNVRVAENLFMKRSWVDTMLHELVRSVVGPSEKYIYSDNDFIFLGKIIESLSGMTLDKYVKKNFYEPMGIGSIGFKPRERFTLDRIAPTEADKYFRNQHLRGDVHDPGAAMFGGVAGHAGLFSDADDIAVIMQMLLDEGKFDGRKYFLPQTISLFTAYNSQDSRRGLGFDKPEKDHATSQDPYPAKSVSPLTFGHTGFTGTCVWADPKYDLVFVFLSNRVNPDGESDKLAKLGVRGKLQEAVYNAMIL